MEKGKRMFERRYRARRIVGRKADTLVAGNVHW